MNKELLADIKEWVEVFADEHIAASTDPENIPLILKRAHTLRVAQESGDIASDLGWSEEDIDLAKAIGFLHDIARFPQYAEFKTFLDPVSFNHGEKAYEMMKDNLLLQDVPSGQREILLDGIRYHNRRDIPELVSEPSLKHLKLIRDADKVDILYSIRLIIKEGWHRQHPGILLDVDIDGPLTPALVDELLKSNSGSYENVHTVADIHLMRIAWIYAITYKPALQHIVERKLYDDTLEFLPDTPEIQEIRRRALEYVQRTLGSD